ncbi:plexin-B-like [Patiria miniata]|uniref:IPT/TIG domain-containing protein n=1 Tax=Patiria miniata TaxID=46514 RepID=A0A914AC99_PATMI|nr:plexin-B-like [Patiria miniata]
MYCISPSIALPSHLLSNDAFLNTSTGFILDGVTALRAWCSDPSFCTLLEYHQNPRYFAFDDPVYKYEDGIAHKDGDTLLLRGDLLDLAITAKEITVYIGPDVCANVTRSRKLLGCVLPQTQPEAGDNLGKKTDKNLPFVRVFHGTHLAFDIGYIRYPSTSITVLVCVVSVVVLLIFVIVAIVIYRKAKSARKEVEERRTDLIMKKIEKTEDMMAASGVVGVQQSEM